MSRYVVAVMLVALIAACAPRASDGGFDSDNPAARLYAIRQAGQQRDPQTVPELVQQLESDDPAVRMLAITALERITGKRLGYNPYASPVERRTAVDAWVAAVEDGSLETASR